MTMPPYTRRRCYSHYDIILNGVRVGNLTAVYHYVADMFHYGNVLTVEIMFNNSLNEIQGINLGNDWKVFDEDTIRTQSENQVHTMALGTIRSYITNHTAYHIDIVARRYAFNIDIKDDVLNPRFVLIHEHDITPNFKQIIIYPMNSYMQFDMNHEDNDIIMMAYERFKELLQ